MERRFASALLLFAHPDDAEFSCGGTAALWARQGCEIHYVVCTDGSAGSNAPDRGRDVMRPIREREQRAAAEAIGASSVTFLGELDGLLSVTPETRRKVCREVRRLRPDVIVAPDPSRLWSGRGYVNHWDHKQAGLLALTTVMPDAPTRVLFQELEDEGIEPFEVPNLWLVSDDADTYVDISETIEVKLAALACHESQGTDRATPWIEERNVQLGAASGRGYAYAEAFKTFSFDDDEA